MTLQLGDVDLSVTPSIWLCLYIGNVYNSVIFINGKKNSYPQSRFIDVYNSIVPDNLITNSIHTVIFHSLVTTIQHSGVANGKMSTRDCELITDHDHCKTDVVRSYSLSLHSGNEKSILA